MLQTPFQTLSEKETTMHKQQPSSRDLPFRKWIYLFIYLFAMPIRGLEWPLYFPFSWRFGDMGPSGFLFAFVYHALAFAFRWFNDFNVLNRRIFKVGKWSMRYCGLWSQWNPGDWDAETIMQRALCPGGKWQRSTVKKLARQWSSMWCWSSWSSRQCSSWRPTSKAPF